MIYLKSFKVQVFLKGLKVLTFSNIKTLKKIAPTFLGLLRIYQLYASSSFLEDEFDFKGLQY